MMNDDNKSKESLKGKTVLITGADGFIGSHLVRRLVKEGATINVFLLETTNIFRIEDVIPYVNVWYGDVKDYQSVRDCMGQVRPQIVFHLAAARDVRREADLMDFMIDTNIKGTLNLLRAIIDDNIPIEYFFNTGTCEEYGNGTTPFIESNRETPVSPYSASKVATTYFCSMLFRTHNIPIVTIRPFLTYGPCQDPDMFIPSLIIHCLRGIDFPMTEGNQTREFNYVDDIIEGYVLGSNCHGIAGEIINIGNGVEYKVKDIAEKIVEMMGGHINLNLGAIPTRRGEAEHFYCNNQKAKTLLGWSPIINLEEGLRRTIEWYTNHYKCETDVV